MARFWSFSAKKITSKKTTLFLKALNQKSDSYKVFPTWIGNFCTCQNFYLGPQKKVLSFFEHFPIFFRKIREKLHNLKYKIHQQIHIFQFKSWHAAYPNNSIFENATFLSLPKEMIVSVQMSCSFSFSLVLLLAIFRLLSWKEHRHEKL